MRCESIPGSEDPLEEEMATHCSTLAWKIPWTEEPGRLMSQFSSVVQSCPALFDLMDCTTPGLPAHHQLPEFIQTHVHWVSDAIQPSHCLSCSSSPANERMLYPSGMSGGEKLKTINLNRVRAKFLLSNTTIIWWKWKTPVCYYNHTCQTVRKRMTVLMSSHGVLVFFFAAESLRQCCYTMKTPR